MSQEQPPIENGDSNEGEPLSPEAEKLASLRERRQKIIGGEFTPEELENEETLKSVEEALANIDQKIEEILEKEGIKEREVSPEPLT